MNAKEHYIIAKSVDQQSKHSKEHLNIILLPTQILFQQRGRYFGTEVATGAMILRGRSNKISLSLV